eukprot:1969707-Amphidinium_carterae.1
MSVMGVGMPNPTGSFVSAPGAGHEKFREHLCKKETRSDTSAGIQSTSLNHHNCIDIFFELE